MAVAPKPLTILFDIDAEFTAHTGKHDRKHTTHMTIRLKAYPTAMLGNLIDMNLREKVRSYGQLKLGISNISNVAISITPNTTRAESDLMPILHAHSTYFSQYQVEELDLTVHTRPTESASASFVPRTQRTPPSEAPPPRKSAPAPHKSAPAPRKSVPDPVKPVHRPQKTMFVKPASQYDVADEESCNEEGHMEFQTTSLTRPVSQVRRRHTVTHKPAVNVYAQYAPADTSPISDENVYDVIDEEDELPPAPTHRKPTLRLKEKGPNVYVQYNPSRQPSHHGTKPKHFQKPRHNSQPAHGSKPGNSQKPRHNSQPARVNKPKPKPQPQHRNNHNKGARQGTSRKTNYAQYGYESE